MKTLPTALKTPTRVVIVVGLIVLVVEFLVMLLIEGIHNTILKDAVPEKIALEFIDPILLVAIVSPAFYLLIFRPMRIQQVELERQLDELRRFEKLTVGRELRMKELVEEIAALRNPLSTEPAGNIPVTSSSLEVPHHAAEQPPATPPTEENQHSALLFMLEDLETARKKIEQAHQEWIAALDVVDDPIFLHDREFRILRCNKAYQQRAGIPFHELIGRPYYEIFPRSDSPLPCCLRAMEKVEEEEEEEEVADGGTIYRSRAFSVHDEQGAYLYSVHSLEDITESKRAAEALSESETRFRNLVETSSDWIWEVDENTFYTYASPKIHDILGYQAAEIIGKTPYDLMPAAEAKRVAELFNLIATARKSFTSLENTNLHKDGRRVVLETNGVPIFDAEGKFRGYRGMDRDITERKQAEALLAESEEKFRKITESAQDAIIMMGADQRITFWNTAAERIFGYTAAEALGQELHPLIAPPAAQAAFAHGFQHFRYSGEGPVVGKVIEINALRKGDEEFPVELSISATQLNGQWHAIGIVRDITGRKRAEQDLIESRRRAQHYLDIAGVMLLSLDAQGRVQMVNRKGCQMLGHSEADILGRDWFDNYLSEPVREEVRKTFNQIMGGDIAPVEYFENDILTANGDTLTVAWHNALLLDESGKISGVLSSGEDITVRKAAEAAIRHANRALATLSAVNRTLVRATSEDELLQAICEAIVQQRGYRLAWVGYKQHDENQSVRIMARAGHDEGYLDAMQLTWAESEHGMGASGRAVHSGKTQLCQDIASDPLFLPWRDAALKCGYAASIALPLGNGEVFGVLNVYAAEANAFTPAEIDLLEEMAGDLAFGVHTLHTRHERDLAMEQNRRHLAQLKDSLEDTVRAIAAIAEMRDPYTAGHQARVAGLAAAIARQIGLPAEQVHAIHLAGTVHDLGKIQIPAEILSKPGRITDIEFSLIKVHPQAGYDILKDIAFPWPIAQMVLQHHERLDGSGYPQGLKGDAILLEARILSVADVVEAMSSHRPYRPGLGIEVALAEITKQRGVHYDPQVADACLAVFREQGYQLPS